MQHESDTLVCKGKKIPLGLVSPPPRPFPLLLWNQQAAQRFMSYKNIDEKQVEVHE